MLKRIFIHYNNQCVQSGVGKLSRKNARATPHNGNNNNNNINYYYYYSYNCTIVVVVNVIRI